MKLQWKTVTLGRGDTKKVLGKVAYDRDHKLYRVRLDKYEVLVRDLRHASFVLARYMYEPATEETAGKVLNQLKRGASAKVRSGVPEARG